MTQQRLILGPRNKLYRNTGSDETPTWNLVPNCRDLTLNMEMEEADVTIRGTSDLLLKLSEPTVLGIQLEFEQVRDPDDADQAHLLLAFRTRTALDLAIAEDDITVGGTEYFRLLWKVFTRNGQEPLTNAKMLSWTLKPCFQLSPVGFVTVAGTTTTTTTTAP